MNEFTYGFWLMTNKLVCYPYTNLFEPNTTQFMLRFFLFRAYNGITEAIQNNDFKTLNLNQ